MDEKLIVTKFLRDEEQIKQDWLCLLMKDEKAPLDVSYRARLIKIVKEYYPIAVFSVTCEAEWQATSYWEHVEEYQVAREETVYIDYQGKEHKSSGRFNPYFPQRSANSCGGGAVTVMRSFVLGWIKDSALACKVCPRQSSASAP